MSLPLLALFLAALAAPDPPAAPRADRSAVGTLRREAEALRPLARSRLGRDFLAATATLPRVPPRILRHDSTRTRWYDERQAAALPDSARARLVARTLDEGFYYTTRYGSPLAYLRPLELLAEAGLADVAGRRIADFGYGTIGHLKLLASLGAQVTGIDVDPLLERLYSAPEDRAVIGLAGRTPGSITLVHGRFPAEPEAARRVGGGYQVFLSKNTLKNGYIHPEQPVDRWQLVDLGVDDTTYVRAVHELLEPGGWFLIYNLSPAPGAPGTPYRPMADGRSPFPRALLEREGFEVLAHDRDDGVAARAMGRALGWDAGPRPMDLENDLFASWTLARKRARGGR